MSLASHATLLSRTFAQSGTCPYGTRCRFIHSASGAQSPHACATRTGSTTPNTGTGTPAPTPSLSPVRGAARPAAHACPGQTGGFAGVEQSMFAERLVPPACRARPFGTHQPLPALSSLPTLTPLLETSLLPEQDASFACLLSLPGTPCTPGAQRSLAFSHSEPSVHSLASLTPSPTSCPLLGAAGTDAAAAASLLNLHSLQGVGATAGAYLPAASTGLSLGGAGLGLGTAASAGYGQLAAGQPGSADTSALAALAALLAGGGLGGTVSTATTAQPISAAATLACSSHPLLGVVGPPAGLAPIGTQAGSGPGAAGHSLAQGPACPGTPGGTAARASLRRSISGEAGRGRKRRGRQCVSGCVVGKGGSRLDAWRGWFQLAVSAAGSCSHLLLACTSEPPLVCPWALPCRLGHLHPHHQAPAHL